MPQKPLLLVILTCLSLMNLQPMRLDAQAPLPPVNLVIVGDIASCELSGDEQTAALVGQLNAQNPVELILTVGDHVYPQATAQNYQDCYDPTWGRYRDITLPAIGNHDRPTAATVDYFNVTQRAYPPLLLDAELTEWGIYGAVVDSWVFVFLNIDVPTRVRAQQLEWLELVLSVSDANCTAALWHQPLFSSGTRGGYPPVREFWQLLETYQAELVFNGHDHHYERFVPQLANGRAAPSGIQQFIVGTGGYYLYDLGAELENTVFRQQQAWGVLKLTLEPDRYQWQFITANGDVLDAGDRTCNAP